MNANEINPLEQTLCTLFDRSILNAVNKTYRSKKKPALQEPDYVAALTKYFTVDLATLLNVLYPDYDFTASSVYCHQKPIVDINASKKPELGDILFVYSEKQEDGSTRYNSLLLQAKICNRSVMRVPASDQHQLSLYKYWPTFTYHRANFLNGHTRDIQPKAINDGAQYLLIDTNPFTNGLIGFPNTFPMGCAIPNDTLIIDKRFSAELVDFLKFKSGRIFEEDPILTHDDWTKMIWDLLLMGTFDYSRRNIGFNKVKRGVYCSNQAGFSQTEIYAKLNEYSVSFDNYILDDDFMDDINRGVSVVMIERRTKTRTDNE